MSRLLQRIGGFSVHAVTTNGGRNAYRVTGTLNGRQLRKQFATETEGLEWAAAQAKAKSLEKIAPEVTGQLLSPAKQVDARAALLELEKAQHNVSLLTCVQFFLVHHRQVQSITLGDAVARYAAEREREYETGTLSSAQSRNIVIELTRFVRTFKAETALPAISRDQIQSYLSNRTPSSGDRQSSGATYSNKTFNNRRSFLVHFFAWCAEHGFASRNAPAEERPLSRGPNRPTRTPTNMPDGA